MLKCKVIRNVFEHGAVYGRKGDIIVVPDHIGKAFSDKRKTGVALELIDEATEQEIQLASTNGGRAIPESEKEKSL